jgi:Na+-driven multidrug efflux pump
MLCAVLRPDAAVYALAVPHLQMKALACPAAVLMFVAVGAFRGFKDTT